MFRSVRRLLQSAKYQDYQHLLRSTSRLLPCNSAEADICSSGRTQAQLSKSDQMNCLDNKGLKVAYDESLEDSYQGGSTLRLQEECLVVRDTTALQAVPSSLLCGLPRKTCCPTEVKAGVIGAVLYDALQPSANAVPQALMAGSRAQVASATSHRVRAPLMPFNLQLPGMNCYIHGCMSSDRVLQLSRSFTSGRIRKLKESELVLDKWLRYTGGPFLTREGTLDGEKVTVKQVPVEARSLVKHELSVYRRLHKLMGGAVPKVLGVGHDAYWTFIAMELVDGVPLGELQKQLQEPLPVLIRERARAGLKAVHEAGVLHGHLHGGNIQVVWYNDGRPLRVVILDWANARIGATKAAFAGERHTLRQILKGEEV